MAVFAFLMWAGLGSSAHAQTSQINGHVTDASGAVVRDAEVKIVNTRTNQAELLHTDKEGRFEAVTLQPSIYDLSVTRAGFKIEQRQGVTLDLDTTTTLDFMLSPGNSTESVVVTADAGQLQPNSPDMATEITERQYQQLPLVQNNRLRNPASFVYLAPGVQGNIRLDGNEYTGATNVIAVNGGPIWDTELLIEGLPGGQTRIVGNYTESSPPVDAINEFKVTTTLLPADYGHTGFAVGSFGIKSGTNLLHGSILEYFRNTALDAANWFAKNQGAVLTNPPIHQNEFGGTVSGPVMIPHLYSGKDKTFFFFAYVGSRFSGATSYGTSTTPTAQELTVNAKGYYDFSDLKTPIYDPATTVANPKGAGFVRTMFPGNLIPADRLDPVARSILDLYPIPKPGTTTIGAFQGDEVLRPDTYTAKVDRILTPAQHFSVAFVHTSVPRINIGSAFPIPLAAGYHQTIFSYTARINHAWTLRPNLVNLANVGYNRFVNRQTPTGTNPDYPGLLGLGGLTGGLFPTFGISGYSTFGDITDSNQVENDFYYKDQVDWTLGRHNLRFGGEYRDVQYNDDNPATTTGAFSFSTNETGNPQSPSGTGNAFASFMLGQVDSATVAVPSPLYTRKTYAGFFVQDDWKILPTLTINLGLREEWQNAPKEAHNNQSILSLTTPNPGAGNLPGALIFAGTASHQGQTMFSTDYSAVGPRIGFAYQLGASTVVRGGYGVYYTDYLPNLGISNAGFAPTGRFPNTTGGVSPVFTLASGVPGYTATQTLTSTALNGAGGSYYGSNVGAMPRTQNYSLSIQRQVTPNTVLEVSYVADRNTRQVNPNLVNINQLDPSYLALGSAVLTSTATATSLAAIGASLPYAGFKGTVAQALRRFPQYSTLTSLGAKVGSSNYNAVQVVARKRVSYGLSLNANYTFGKELGYPYANLEGNAGTENSVQNAYDPGADYSLLAEDVRHALVLNETYELPFGKGRRLLNEGKLTTALAGGWTVSGIERYQSGFPLPLVMSSNALPLFNYYQRPNLNPGIDPSSHISNHDFKPATDNIFNRAAFAAPGSSSFGNARPYYSNLRNFPVLTEDVQLTKQTSLSEKLTWSLYAQVFNPANRHRFAGFGTAFGASNFGVPNATTAARSLQFGTRFAF